MAALRRYGLQRAGATSAFETLSGGQQARFQVLLLELSGATLLLLDEPTDNLDLAVGRGAEEALERVRRHGARGHARPLVRPLASTASWSSGADGAVVEAAEPVWDETRPERKR